MMYQANQQFPVPIDTWDPSTVNHALPNGNDVWPAVQVPPNLQGPTMERIAVEFRTTAQSRLNKSPLHNLVYNLFSQNRFQNSVYTEWVQRAMDFAEFLIVAQNNQPDVAVGKAVQKIYFSALAMITSQYPAISQYLDRPMMDELIRAGQEFNDIIRDLQAFQQAGRRPLAPAYGQPAPGYNPPMQYGGGQPHQLPPVMQGHGGYNAYHQPQAPRMMNHAQMAPQGYQPHQAPAMNYGASQGPRVGSGSGRYVDEPVTPAQPTPAPQQSWQAAPSTAPVNTIKPIAPPQFNQAPQAPAEPDLPAPATLDEVVINPKYYVPEGFVIDPDRAYDLIHNPGGVELRPAHLSGWKRTRSDAQPYAQGYDPEQYLLFHVRWPDGVVQEKIVEWTTDMEYLKHEVDDNLRALRMKPTGKVVVNTHKILGIDAAPEPAAVVKMSLDDDLNTDSEMAPVLLDGVFGGFSDMENEQFARKQTLEELGLPKDSAVVPAHVYHSARIHPLDVTSVCEKRLTGLEVVEEMWDLASRLKGMLNDGTLPLRYYRFIDDRLTNGINRILAENLSMDNCNIDSFVDDVDDLLAALVKREGPEIATVINSHTKAFVKRWLTFVKASDEGEEEETQFSLIDECINLQTGWALEQIGSLNMAKGPVLLSRASHPKLHDVVMELMTSKDKTGQLAGRCLRLITADGVYLEVMRGWLVKGSILIKKH